MTSLYSSICRNILMPVADIASRNRAHRRPEAHRGPARARRHLRSRRDRPRRGRAHVRLPLEPPSARPMASSAGPAGSRAILETGFGLPAGLLGPTPGQGTLLSNLTVFLASNRPHESSRRGGGFASRVPGVPGPLATYAYRTLAVRRLEERVRVAGGEVIIRSEERRRLSGPRGPPAPAHLFGPHAGGWRRGAARHRFPRGRGLRGAAVRAARARRRRAHQDAVQRLGRRSERRRAASCGLAARGALGRAAVARVSTGFR